MHNQPNGRPIHPSCTHNSGDSTALCSCDRLWHYWDGTIDSVKHYQAIEHREAISSDMVGGEVVVFDTSTELGGFFRQSEMIKTALDNEE